MQPLLLSLDAEGHGQPDSIISVCSHSYYLSMLKDMGSQTLLSQYAEGLGQPDSIISVCSYSYYLSMLKDLGSQTLLSYTEISICACVKEQYDVGGISIGQSSAIPPPPSPTPPSHLTYTTLTSTNVCQIAGWWGQCIPVKMACSSWGIILFPVPLQPPSPTQIQLTLNPTNLCLTGCGQRRLVNKALLQFKNHFTFSLPVLPPPPPLLPPQSDTHTHLHKLLSDGRLGAAQTGQKGLLQFGRQFTSGQALVPAAPVQLCQLSELRSHAASRYPQPVQSASSANAES